jgi:hypothetical protein
MPADPASVPTMAGRANRATCSRTFSAAPLLPGQEHRPQSLHHLPCHTEEIGATQTE